MAGCEERNVVSNEDKSYNTFELQPSKTATISIDSYQFNITVFDFDDKVESYGNEECGLGDGNRFFVNMEINGQEIIAHSEIGGPDEYSMPLDKAAEDVAQKLESIAENGANADYRTIFERSTEIDDSYMIALIMLHLTGTHHHRQQKKRITSLCLPFIQKGYCHEKDSAFSNDVYKCFKYHCTNGMWNAIYSTAPMGSVRCSYKVSF